MVLIAILPALGVIIYSGSELRQNAIDNTRERALIILHSLTNEHERTVEVTHRLLIVLSKMPDIRSLKIPACNRILSDILAENPLYANIFLATSQGVVVASAQPFKPHSVLHRKYFQDAIRKKGFSVGEYTVGVTVKKPVLHFAYPVIDSRGVFKGIVVVALDLDRYKQMLIMAKLPGGSNIALSDYRHIRLLRYPHPEKYAGLADLPSMVKHMTAEPEEGVFLNAGVDEVKRLYAYKRFYLKKNRLPYLFMRVGIPEEQALSQVKKTLFINMTLLCCAFIIAMASAWFAGDVIIIRRLKKLEDASLRLGKGDLSTRTGLQHRTDELGQLTKTFDDMAAELEHKESQRKQAENLLQTSEEMFSKMFYFNPVMVAISTIEEGRFIHVNTVFCDKLGYTPGEIIGKTSMELHIFPDPEERAHIRQMLMAAGNVRDIETRVCAKDGSIINGLFSAEPILIEGENCWITAMTDITDRKQAEEQIKSSLREKNVLLKELQHRVKNNLLTISGILALQLSRMKDNESKDALVTSVNRINALTKIHTRLYQSGDFSLIGFKEYIEELLWELSRSYEFPSENIITDIQDISLDINTAIPAGLMVNELVSNAMKHAFPPGERGTRDEKRGPWDVGRRTWDEKREAWDESSQGAKGEEQRNIITVSLKKDEEDDKDDARCLMLYARYSEFDARCSEDDARCLMLDTRNPHPRQARTGPVTLTVSDNGIGFPAHIDINNTESIGLSLLVQLVEQINGTMELVRDKGTQFIITFSID